MVTANQLNSLCDVMITYHIDQKATPLERVKKLKMFRTACEVRLKAEWEKWLSADIELVASHYALRMDHIASFTQAQIDRTVRSHLDHHNGEIDKWKSLRC